MNKGAPSVELKMVPFKEITTKVTAMYLHYLSIMTVIMMIIQDSRARELRPSDHGLEYQSMPPTEVKFPPEMKEFFGASSAATNTTSPGAALPKAMNSNDTSWWRTVGGDGRKSGGDHVRHVLLVASLVCGVTGLGLLVASALIYYFVRRNKQSPPPPPPTNNNHRSITVYAGKN